MRSREFTEMDTARRIHEAEHKLNQAEMKLAIQIEKINEMRAALGIRQISVDLDDWERGDE
jgi:hypothetical protein